ERKRIAREIHDGIGPLLSTIKIYLESASDDLKEGKNNKVFEKIANITQMIDSVAIDIRSISHDLMPRVLEDFGLVAALENLCDKMNKLNKINVTFYTSGINGRFKKLEFGIYRIAQELMNNAFKHSEAKNLTLQLIQHKNSIVLMTEDNGIGFDLVKITKENTGIGLKNVEARVKALGGILDIDTAIGRGVTTTIEIPITN
ncbi:MAG: sensor histidine kinase, partial [Bacteroidales bacterium]|nr:sensor histidine kinase [Bacteroidales bacterium]